MEKQKRITLNADKRKVIADVFQETMTGLHIVGMN